MEGTISIFWVVLPWLLVIYLFFWLAIIIDNSKTKQEYIKYLKELLKDCRVEELEMDLRNAQIKIAEMKAKIGRQAKRIRQLEESRISIRKYNHNLIEKNKELMQKVYGDTND